MPSNGFYIFQCLNCYLRCNQDGKVQVETWELRPGLAKSNISLTSIFIYHMYPRTLLLPWGPAFSRSDIRATCFHDACVHILCWSSRLPVRLMISFIGSRDACPKEQRFCCDLLVSYFLLLFSCWIIRERKKFGLLFLLMQNLFQKGSIQRGCVPGYPSYVAPKPKASP